MFYLNINIGSATVNNTTINPKPKRKPKRNRKLPKLREVMLMLMIIYSIVDKLF